MFGHRVWKPWLGKGQPQWKAKRQDPSHQIEQEAVGRAVCPWRRHTAMFSPRGTHLECISPFRPRICLSQTPAPIAFSGHHSAAPNSAILPLCSQPRRRPQLSRSQPSPICHTHPHCVQPSPEASWPLMATWLDGPCTVPERTLSEMLSPTHPLCHWFRSVGFISQIPLETIHSSLLPISDLILRTA